MLLFSLLAVAIAFTLSAAAGMGGSLILVPIMSIMFGSKTGIAISAILLGFNNIFKTIAYQKNIPWKISAKVMIFMVFGAALGAKVMVTLPEWLIDIAILTSFVLAFLFEKRKKDISFVYSFYALGAGIFSGFSGTSGPLKGMALRTLDLNKAQLVGAASIVSLMSDLVKSGIFINASLLNDSVWEFIGIAFFITPCAVYLGKLINHKISEYAYTGLFWIVMTGYSFRLFFI